jgi:two-component system chemotaxis response regulator CheY
MSFKQLATNLTMMKMNMVIVDDEPSVCTTIKAMLLQLGSTSVKTFTSAEDVLEHIHSNEEVFDIIISDWNMPGLTGLEFLRHIRHEQGKELPFLMITGRNDIQSVVEAKKYGVTSYIIKPFGLDELKEKIEVCCTTIRNQ